MKISQLSTYIIVTIACALCFQVSVSTVSAWTVGNIYLNTNLVKKYTDKQGNAYSLYKKPEITVITPTSFSFNFNAQGQRAVDLVRNNGCNAVLNGTYFWHDQPWVYYPAWVWYEFWNFIRAPYQPAIDKNLQVLLSGNGTTIDMLDNNSFDFRSVLSASSTPNWYVNAGPWLVRDWKINATVLNNSSHWQRATTRVGVIKNPNWVIHFVVATQPISLPQFIVFAYNTWLWTGAFQFVNFDGGSSTSLYTPYNSYQSRKTLPSFICIQ